MALIATIEASLKKHFAVKDIAVFDRRYAFSIGTDGVDSNRADFSATHRDHQKTGVIQSVVASQFPILDDSQFYYVDGHYDISKKKTSY